jgi:hypothetical protein
MNAAVIGTNRVVTVIVLLKHKLIPPLDRVFEDLSIGLRVGTHFTHPETHFAWPLWRPVFVVVQTLPAGPPTGPAVLISEIVHL